MLLHDGDDVVDGIGRLDRNPAGIRIGSLLGVVRSEATIRRSGSSRQQVDITHRLNAVLAPGNRVFGQPSMVMARSMPVFASLPSHHVDGTVDFAGPRTDLRYLPGDRELRLLLRMLAERFRSHQVLKGKCGHCRDSARNSRGFEKASARYFLASSISPPQPDALHIFDTRMCNRRRGTDRSGAER